MSTMDNFLSNQTKVSYSTVPNIDRVIFATAQTFNITNSIGTYTDSIGTPTPSQLVLPVGIYTFNGGATFLDLRGTQAISSLNKNPTLPSVYVIASGNSVANIDLSFQVISTVGAGATIPVTVYVACLATDTPATASEPPGGAKTMLSSPLGTSAPARKARTIAFSNTQAIESGVSPLHSYAHNQGVVPNVMFWDMSGGKAKVLGTNTIDQRFAVGGVFTAKMDATNVYIGGGNPPFTSAYYRGYYER